jgi:DNA-directed RNA polymerase specialized sigma subunit
VNPVTDFLTTKEAARQQQRQDELAHLERWRASQDPEHLAPLLRAYEPVIAQKIRQWKAPAVPEPAFRAELQKHMIKAFQTFDPSKGAQLPTHVENNMKKALRYNNKYQNVAYIPEGQTKFIGQIQRAQNTLTQDLGRDPTHDEIADHIGMPVKQVSKIMTNMRRDVPASAFETDPAETEMHRDQEVLDLLPYNLTNDEKRVFNHIFGREGAPQISSTNALAAALSKSPSQISRLRTSILTKYKAYR